MSTQIEIADCNGSPCLVLAGSMNIRNAGEMWRAVGQLAKHNVEISLDLERANYLDCSILQQLLLLRANASNLRFANTPASLADDFRLIGLSDGQSNQA